jgi:hypothetical protein
MWKAARELLQQAESLQNSINAWFTIAAQVHSGVSIPAGCTSPESSEQDVLKAAQGIEALESQPRFTALSSGISLDSDSPIDRMKREMRSVFWFAKTVVTRIGLRQFGNSTFKDDEDDSDWCERPASWTVVKSLRDAIFELQQSPEMADYRTEIARELLRGDGSATAQVATTNASPQPESKTARGNGWKPSKATQKVIKLMEQGLSNDTIAERSDVKAKTTAANLRQIRTRATKAGLLSTVKRGKRDMA